MARTLRLTLLPVLWLAVIAGALWVLESARAGVTITHTRVGDTPVMRFVRDEAGPDVVVAHGFAGSAAMMQSYALALAQAGYDVHAFDFFGHGRHPAPMSGDLDRIDGVTRQLVEQTKQVMAAVSDGPPALLGHSMATDILPRISAEVPVGPVVMLSGFSGEVTAKNPAALLLLVGAGEPRLIDFAETALRQVDPEAALGQTVTQGDVTRRAVVLPWIEHVSILHSARGRAEAVAWIDAALGRESAPPLPQTGLALLALLFGIVALSPLVASVLPRREVTPRPLSLAGFAEAVLVPALIAPLLAVAVYVPFLPVLVADYLALHLGFYAVIQAAVLWHLRRPVGRNTPLAGVLLLVWGLVVFGFALDRYGANFWPVAARVPIILALAIGAVPFMLADAVLVQNAPLWQRVLARIGFLASLGIAVALDTEGLFFLLLIAPVIVLFFLVYGTMGRAFARRTGPLPRGLALGLILAWALGTSFPLFAS